MIIQFTGLSGVGKTTLAEGISQKLKQVGLEVVIIDGDVFRKTVCRDLGYSKLDRIENIRRLGEIAASYPDDHIVIIAAINPYKEARDELKRKYNSKLVWLNCSLSTLLKRDPKGLYERAYLPDTDPLKVVNLTGVNDVFELPVNPDLILNTDVQSLVQCINALYQVIKDELKQANSER